MHRQMEEEFKDAKDVVFFHMQTVFEGGHVNTPANGRKVTERAGIKSPVGYDARADGERTSLIMSQYGTGGTPWTIVIDKTGKVTMNEVTPEANKLATHIRKLRKG